MFICICVFGCVSRAAELLMQTGDCVSLKVAMQGAMYHGLATLLNKPSPVAPPHGLLLFVFCVLFCSTTLLSLRGEV